MRRAVKLRVVLMGRKAAAAAALEYLLERGHQITLVISSESGADGRGRPLEAAAGRRGIPVWRDEQVYARLGEGAPELAGVDLALSYLHRRRILPELIALPRIGCFNFHPAPLPELRGVGGYNFAILENRTEYGVSAHWVAPEIDAGDLVEVRRFPIQPAEQTAWSLERKTQAELFALFCRFIRRVERGEPLPRRPQGAGRYISRAQMLEAMRIQPGDPPELVDRKARAFWFPPHAGAYVELGGRRFTLAPELGLRQWAEAGAP